MQCLKRDKKGRKEEKKKGIEEKYQFKEVITRKESRIQRRI